jgi:hypothetical protein
MPRWTLGTACSGSPLNPMVPTGAPSSTESPFATVIEPRWTSVTAYPSDVRIVTPRPCVGSEPANATVPAAGARTGDPSSPPTSIPRCCPAAYASGPSVNGRSTAPSAGHVQAPAGPPSTSAASVVAPITRRRCTRHLLRSLRGQRGGRKVARPSDGVNPARRATRGRARCGTGRRDARRRRRQCVVRLPPRRAHEPRRPPRGARLLDLRRPPRRS